MDRLAAMHADAVAIWKSAGEEELAGVGAPARRRPATARTGLAPFTGGIFCSRWFPHKHTVPYFIGTVCD